MSVMNKLNEKQIIEIFQKRLRNSVFISEDVEFFKINGNMVVSKTDTLVESTDVPPKMTMEDIARKSVVSAVSDFAAKGVRPSYGVISITFPKKISKKKIIQFANGFAKAAKEFNIKFLGGDTNEGKEIVVQVSLFGIAKNIVKRKGAKIGDVIISTGPFGYTKAGLSILLKNKNGNRNFMKKSLKTVLKPTPRLEFGLTNRDYFSSSMDSSDGLSSTINEMSKQSKKKFVITKLPSNDDLFDFARQNRLDPHDLIFNGGEEYEIIATLKPSDLSKIKKNAKKQKIPLIEMGFVKKGIGAYFENNEKSYKIKDGGWLHFRS